MGWQDLFCAGHGHPAGEEEPQRENVLGKCVSVILHSAVSPHTHTQRQTCTSMATVKSAANVHTYTHFLYFDTCEDIDLIHSLVLNVYHHSYVPNSNPYPNLTKLNLQINATFNLQNPHSQMSSLSKIPLMSSLSRSQSLIGHHKDRGTRRHTACRSHGLVWICSSPPASAVTGVRMWTVVDCDVAQCWHRDDGG